MDPCTIKTVKCGYVEAAGRLVHYRFCGAGPAVVLLHDSPRSSRLHLPLMQVLATRYCVFALDTAGYGNSDPLDMEEPALPDFAHALGKALTALGLEQAPIYATHTSAKIALALAVREGQMSKLILDGLSIPDQLASEAFLQKYMRPFAPEATGAWLGAEWSRTRDMLRWFPWFATNPQNRIAMEPPTPEWLEDYGIDLFSAGPHYAGAYTAAMRWNPLDDLRAVKIPTVVGARTEDVLYPHLDKVPCTENAALSVQRLGPDRDKWAQWICDALSSPAPRKPALASLPLSQNRRGYLSLDQGNVHWECYPAKVKTDLPAILVLSAPSTLEAHCWAKALSEHRKVLVPDLPGFGDSDALSEPDADQIAFALAALVGRLEEDACDVLAIGLAAPIGARMVARHKGLVRALAIWGAPSFDPPSLETLCPPVAFDALAGSHLHSFWHMLRDSAVQWPWFDARPSSARPAPDVPEASELHRALTGMLKQRTNYAQPVAAALAAHDPSTWQAVNVPTLVAVGHDPAMAGAASLLDLLPNGTAFIAQQRLDNAAQALALALQKVGSSAFGEIIG
ncbi:hypothetical protein IP81_14070 [Novosphingobium sp. AAP83]|uniref:alpha/beta fold hydrolase n=1 Tax=Novosphingobium sp. AAP83 TaxID=1523425 RepID=UPI0006B8C534|nr:alpha/beta hydrolase [Novosphingobium sp. AAP83]KPF90782.1 hypothetical protein IP81_14070 [Novosphingobium sp. AAP83]